MSYGAPPSGNGSYRQLLLEEVKKQVDLTQVHFLGKVPYPDFVRLMQLSSVHVYLTYPFVLSWSMLEAMAGGGFGSWFGYSASD